MGQVIEFPAAMRRKNAASARTIRRLLEAEYIDDVAVGVHTQMWFETLNERAQKRWLEAGLDWADPGKRPTAYDAWCAYDAQETERPRYRDTDASIPRTISDSP